MIDRYTRPAMGRIWSLENRYQAWLAVEIAACEAWAELGVIPEEAVAEIKAKARLDVPRILAIEAKVHHDVIAFTTQLAETIGPASRYVHYGLTSTDVVDTAQGLLLKQAVDQLLSDVDALIATLASQAKRYRHQAMMGRTHGVHADVTTLGLKFALWYSEMQRNRGRLERARAAVAVGKLSGAVGTYANVDPRVEELVCARLGLEAAKVSTQVLQRDRHAELVTTLAIVAGSLDKFATEIRHLQRTEVREVEEPFRAGQKGSSAMPHKRNPEKCERISGLARVVRGHAVTALEDIALWHERDISHSSAERVILPDATILLDYMLALFTEVVADLHVYPEQMARNIALTGGLVASQRVLLRLVEKGMSREEAYRLVQDEAMAAWQGGPSFEERMRSHPDVVRTLGREELDAVFDHSAALRHVDTIFSRLGLDDE